ncbi:hypothetical protein BDA96_03G091100 [Sorghum bicolor]|uniref:Uncharacterized protein n=1 Tax=Sorghum bicolor TaxID=4558 RepID=A0A921ULM8_SORBI|nr:uncharacterized protein LOC8073361 isoform X2 [Sorghum bicolor]KAG0536757.1 hypothetical protein BDA96_03G091100 [Sorghum bicolor]|eukprot:XP_021313135.1 uncharacterized protein LOC8073361 isoform X2 [Sorghum bicolor]
MAMDDVAGSSSMAAAAASDPSHGWQTVSYPKRNRKQAPRAAAPDLALQANGKGAAGGVFDAVEKRSQERHRALQQQLASRAADLDDARIAAATGAGAYSDDEDSDEAAAPRQEGEVKKPKKPKVKKPKVTVAEAAALIDAENLAAHLIEISASYENQQDIQLMRFADYFGRAFVAVSASQFPWAKMFKESTVSKMVDIPLCHIPEAVIKTASDWISQRSSDALGDFVLWCIDSIMSELSGPSAGPKGSKKVAQQSPRAQVAIFVVLAMALRRKPDVLVNVMPKIMGNNKYLGQEKLPIIVWVIAQASQGDLVTGMFCWAHSLFPTLCAKSSGNPLARDLVLQLLERILSVTKARSILLNGAVRRGERLVPPVSFDLFMRATFPVSNARATERFEAAYPTIKELALAGPPGSKTVKQASQQLLPLCAKAMQENNAELTREATDVFIWCLTQNAESYKQWERIYPENIEASVAVLSKIVIDWKDVSPKLSSEALKATVKNFKAKNEAALESATDAGKQASIKEADKHCKVILGKLTRGATCLKSSLVVIGLAVAAGFVLYPDMDLPVEWEKVQAMVSSHLSF